MRAEQGQQRGQQAELHPGPGPYSAALPPGRPALIDPGPPGGRIAHPDNKPSLQWPSASVKSHDSSGVDERNPKRKACKMLH